ncbi:MAG: ABC transporter substrate-binding protein [Rhodospirillales bacterium]|nr:ABC transporter substrate-binding protein [Rhodospirillales bacterium]
MLKKFSSTKRFADKVPIAIGRTLRSILVVFILSLWQMSAQNAYAGPATELVEKFHSVLIDVMKKADKMNVQKRYDILLPRVQETFELPFMVRITSGVIWRKASAPEKEMLLDAFTRMSVSTYASRFDRYSGQKFETIKEISGPKGSMLVQTKIVSPGDPPVKLTYVMMKFDAKWRVIDVILAGGISELALRHSEYRAILKESGPKELARVLVLKSNQLLK